MLWSAALAGRPVRPGVSPTGGLLLPLRKGRTNEEAPTFVVELLYLQRAAGWTEKGDAHLELPAVDLPVSRTGLTLHHSPRFEVAPNQEPSGWRAIPVRGAPLCRAESLHAARGAPPPAAPTARRSKT